MDVTSIDFTLSPGGVVTGTVTSRDTGIPVANLILQACCVETGYEYIGFSDIDGYYTISGLRFGNYRVQAPSPIAQTDWKVEFYNNKTSDAEADIVNVSSENPVAASIDFSLEPKGAISGRVTDNVTGLPVSSAQVNVLTYDSLSGNHIFIKGTQTSTDGYYMIAGIPDGEYAVRVDPGNDYVLQYYPYTPFQFNALPVTISEQGSVSGIDFSLKTGGSITGTAVDTTTSQPISNLQINAMDFNTNSWMAGTQTDVNGTYTLVVPTGTFKVQTHAANTGLTYVDECYNNKYGGHNADMVAVNAPGITANIDFSLDIGGSITGAVIDSTTSLPIPNLHVYATDFTTDEWVAGSNTDSNGTYTLIVPSGTFQVRTHAANTGLHYVDECYNNKYGGHNADIVTVNAPGVTANIDFSLDIGGSITGTAIDTATSQPIANLQINAMDFTTDSWMAGTQTDINGHYQLIVPSGTFQVRTHAANSGLNYVDESFNNKYGGKNADTVTVNAPGVTANIDFSLDIGGSITGTVIDSTTSLPIPNLHIYATDFTTNEWMAGSNTDTNGNYKLVLPAGTYRIRACATCSGLDYQDELFNNTDDFNSATVVTVTVSETTSDINFSLDQYIPPAISPVRDLPVIAVREHTFNIYVNFTALSDDCNSIGLKELVPEGWEIALNNAWCAPVAMSSHIEGNKAYYVWDGPVNAGTQFTAVYQVTVPFNAVPDIYSFEGSLEYYVKDQGPFTVSVDGDTDVVIVEEAIIQGKTREVNGSILPGVRVKLNGMPSEVSDDDAIYRIIAMATGTHTLVASKTGYRNETLEIAIDDINRTWTANFEANSGLIPNAPDMSYVLACINKWKFPPAGLGLELSKVLAVINAWKYPVTSNPDEPQYGGVLNIVTNADLTVWNPAAVPGQSPEMLRGLVLEQILGIDRTKGPAGTGETHYLGGPADFQCVEGSLITSWEIPSIGVWVLHVRQGVHFGYRPGFPASELVNGREMTAEDVAFSLEYVRDNPTLPTVVASGLMQNMTVERTALWTITVRTPVNPGNGYLWLLGGGGYQYVWPKEFLQTYGTSNDWHDVVGTGPYVIGNYTPGSSVRYIKNNDYWDTNPVGPGTGNQLPYMDGVNYLIIPDKNTRLAALRTGLVDFSSVDTLTKPELDGLATTNPDIQYTQTIIAPLQISGRVDLPGNPFSDVRIRKAMMIAIDHPGIVANYYGGQAELLDSPARKWYSSVYTPLNELPEAVRELYGYNPLRAKELLNEAGYKFGFKTNMIVQNSPESEQAAAIIKEYWAAIGIDLQVTIQEPVVFVNTWVSHQSEDLILSSFPGGSASLESRYSLDYFRGGSFFNMSHVNNPPGTDPTIETAYNTIRQNIMINYPAADQSFKDVVPYILENAFLIPMPAPWGYRIWQPWLKNYYGESDLKYWLKYAWIDQDLQYAMTGR